MQKIGLLESARHGGNYAGGSAASVALHVVVIALAIAVTSHAGRDFSRDRAIFIPLPKWQPPAENVKRAEAAPPTRTKATAPRVPAISVEIPAVIPPSIPGPTLVNPVPTTFGTAASPLSGSPGGTDSLSDAALANTPLEGYEVDSPAAVLPGQRAPEYPEGLRARGVGGHVVARFVVEKNGRVESEPTIVSSTAAEFAVAVKRYLSAARYRPAVYKGQPVRQLARQNFEFSIRR